MLVHILIENAAQMDKNLCMALCCQNQEYRGTGQLYGHQSNASISIHSISIHSISATVLGLLKKKKKKKKT